MSLRGHGGSGAAPRRRCGRTPTTWSRWPPACRARRCWSGTAPARWWWRTRWPATRPGPRVLVAPVFGGWATLGAALRRNPLGTLPGRVRRAAAAEPPSAVQPRAAGRAGRGVPADGWAGPRPRAQWQLLARRRAGGAGRRPAGAGGRAARTTGWCRGRRWTGSAAPVRRRAAALPRHGPRPDARRRLAGADRRDPRLAGQGAESLRLAPLGWPAPSAAVSPCGRRVVRRRLRTAAPARAGQRLGVWAVDAQRVQVGAGPGADVVLAQVLAHRPHPPPGVGRLGLHRAAAASCLSPSRSCGLTRYACVSSAAAPANSLSTSAPVPSDPGGHVLLGDQVHPVAQRGDHHDVGGPVERGQLGAVERLVEVVDGRLADPPVLAVDPADLAARPAPAAPCSAPPAPGWAPRPAPSPCRATLTWPLARAARCTP